VTGADRHLLNVARRNPLQCFCTRSAPIPVTTCCTFLHSSKQRCIIVSRRCLAEQEELRLVSHAGYRSSKMFVICL
jgi:hypothetical protein